MQESILRLKSKEFAKQVILACREMRGKRIEAALTNQLLRSGTSVGANIYEAQFAQSAKVFIYKLEIALKECNESDYWLELLNDTGSINHEKYSELHAKCNELRRLLISSITTLKNKQGA